MKPKHLCLFSGIGGFILAAQAAGFETVQAVEIEPFCQRVLNKNFPGLPVHGDIRDYDATILCGRIGLLTGGFPCQDISIAGKGEGIEGKRSGLWSEMFRVIRECRPAFCLIENVPALRNRGADRVLSDLEGAGYTAGAFVVGADTLGATHRRKRVWIVAYTGHRAGRTVGAVETGLDAPGEWSTDNGKALRSIADVAYACNTRLSRTGSDPQPESAQQFSGDSDAERDVADTDGSGRGEHRGEQSGREELPSSQHGSAAMAYAESEQTFSAEPGGLHAESANEGDNVAFSTRCGEREPGNESLPVSSGRRTRHNNGRGGELLPAFPPARNDFRGWSAVAGMDASLMPCAERSVCGMADGLPDRVDGFKGSHRNARLKALGNAILPECAYLFTSWIASVLKGWEDEEDTSI